MRKMHQQQALEFVKLLEQANKEIKASIERKDIAGAQSLLADCQEGAIRLGNLIETAEGKGFVTIPLLEEYCELVYRFYERLDKGEDVKDGKAYKLLHSQLIKIGNSVKNDIKVRKEIAFMPYKASMWDSLESIWQAAKEDDECDVYVVPIPYYDRKSDHSFGTFHYEGGDFPDYVPVTRYDTYDLAKRRPDIIYIHNPYDNFNYVTSVDPRFYSSELKQYTELLVYVPYFVCDEQSMGSTLEKYMASGVCNADIVILQSANLQRILVEFLMKKVGGDRKYWEKKLVGLGSPKYDKVLDLDRARQNIPEDWDKAVRREDGRSKRVVLYNTSVGPLLVNDMQMLQKIRSVLQYFYENREKYTLLWRPHPLIKATIESMRPYLWEEYQQIVEEYVAGGWGIYDDTSDFHVAFSLSDVYYGDYSSLVWLYQATGKPLLQQSTDILDYTKRYVTDVLYYDGEYIWSTALEFNGLFRIHPETEQVEYVGAFPDEKPEGYQLFWGMAESDGKLYFCPYHAKHIAVFDKSVSAFYTISFRETIEDVEKKFADIAAYGKYIYFRGRDVNVIAQLDTKTEEITYIENWADKISKAQTVSYDSLLQNGCVHEGYLYYFSQGARGLLGIALHNLSYEFIPLQYHSKDGYTRVVSGGGFLWLLPAEGGCLACFDPQTRSFTEFDKIDTTVIFCAVDNYGYFFSTTKPCFYRIHMETMEITVFSFEKGIRCACAVGNKIFMTAYLTGEWYVLDTVSLKITKGILSLDESQCPSPKVKEMVRENEKYNRYARESGYINLGNLMEAAAENGREPMVSVKGNCGSEIHAYVKGLAK